MATTLDLSKVAQDQILATIKQGQELALSGVELWAASIAPFAKAAQSRPVELPAAEDLVANSFGFAEQILASQQAFAQKVVAASAPVFAAAAPKQS